MEFDKNKILTVVTADQAKVGQKGWFASNIETLSRLVLEEQPKELFGFDSNNAVHAFKTVFQNHALFYPAPESTYTERQAEWVKENNVKAGTKVRVTRTFVEDENGSCCFAHDDLVGEKGIVQAINPSSLGINMNDGYYKAVPYFALEVIKEPTYRPFKNAEEFKPYREKWCLGNMNGRFKIDWHNDTHIYEYGDSFITWEEAFSKYKFEDGTPFGIKEQS